MSKPQTWLGALLAAQLLLAGGLYARGRQVEARQTQQSALLSFDKASVDKLVLTDKDHKVTLVKTPEGWRLPDYQNLPVDQTKLDVLLSALADLKSGWPVATSADSHEQFEVGDKKFAQKVEVEIGGKPVAQLLMGTSPGFRKTHVRSGQEANVYEGAISSMDVPMANDQWLDRSLLKAKELSQIKGNDFLLKKTGQTWKLDGKDSAKLNSANANALAALLQGLQVESPLTAAPTTPPDSSWEMVEGDKPVTYQFWKSAPGPTVKRSDNDKSFTLPKATYDMLMSYNLAKLTEKGPDVVPGDPSASSSATPSP